MPITYNAAVWRQMADRARALVDRVGNPALKAPIARMAAGFDALAERVDKLVAKRAANPDQPTQPDGREAPGGDPPP